MAVKGLAMAWTCCPPGNVTTVHGHDHPRCLGRLPTRLAVHCGPGSADHTENPAASPEGCRCRPGEHLCVAVLQTPRTEIVKRGPTGIRQQDIRHTRGDAVAHQLV